MINRQVLPYNFNISIIKPLIKDHKKSNLDVSNLRPIAISDSLSNLHEAVLLDLLYKETNDNPKQLGFKRKASCQHAIWLLKRAIEFQRGEAIGPMYVQSMRARPLTRSIGPCSGKK